jgi:hypothetical protein
MVEREHRAAARRHVLGAVQVDAQTQQPDGRLAAMTTAG